MGYGAISGSGLVHAIAERGGHENGATSCPQRCQLMRRNLFQIYPPVENIYAEFCRGYYRIDFINILDAGNILYNWVTVGHDQQDHIQIQRRP